MIQKKLLILFVSGCVGSLIFGQVAPKKVDDVEAVKVDTLELDTIRMYQQQLNAELRNLIMNPER